MSTRSEGSFVTFHWRAVGQAKCLITWPDGRIITYCLCRCKPLFLLLCRKCICKSRANIICERIGGQSRLGMICSENHNVSKIQKIFMLGLRDIIVYGWPQMLWHQTMTYWSGTHTWTKYFVTVQIICIRCLQIRCAARKTAVGLISLAGKLQCRVNGWNSYTLYTITLNLSMLVRHSLVITVPT